MKNELAGAEEDECIPLEFDENLVESMKHVMRYLYLSLLFIGIILDLAICKYRDKADFIIYLELAFGILSYTMPYEGLKISELYVATMHFIIFVSYYTDSGRQLVAISLRHCLIAFIAMPLVYLKEMTFTAMLSEAFLLIGIIAINSIVAMMIQYISELHSRIHGFNKENI